MTDQPSKPVYPEPQNFPEALNEPPEAPAEAPAPVAVPHVEHSYSPAQFACVRCGSKNLARGMIVDYGERFEQVRFAPRRLSLNWLNSLFNLRPWRALIKLDAVACRDCGAVLLVIDPEELRRAEPNREY
jgi:DNA-directed RNA polymerase subunit RPC12/RpoP